MALVEMCVGITASCMPSLNQFFRRRDGSNGGSFLRSYIFHPLSSWKSKPSDNQLYNLDHSSGKKAYKNVDDWSNQGSQTSTYGQSKRKTVQTYIRSGRRSGGDDGMNEDGIHLKYGIVTDVDHRGVVTPPDDFTV